MGTFEKNAKCEFVSFFCGGLKLWQPLLLLLLLLLLLMVYLLLLPLNKCACLEVKQALLLARDNKNCCSIRNSMCACKSNVFYQPKSCPVHSSPILKYFVPYTRRGQKRALTMLFFLCFFCPAIYIRRIISREEASQEGLFKATDANVTFSR